MKKIDNTIKTGIQMFLAVITYFFVVKWIGLGDITELRFLNYLIVIYFSSKLAHNNLLEVNSLSYLNNLSSVFVANGINVVLCSLGFLVYLSFINPSYSHVIDNDVLLGYKASNLHSILALFLEGMGASMAVSYTVMIYWRNYKPQFIKVDLTKYRQ